MKDQPASTFARVEFDTPRYREALEPRDVGRGVLAAHRNARRLFRDALLLAEHGRYPSAMLLAILAQEEAAKPETLGHIAIEPSEPDRAQAWRKLHWAQFEDHAQKNLVTIEMHRLFGSFPPEVRDELEKMDARAHAKDFVRLRERCTYADCVQGAERWSLPETIVLDREAVLVFLTAIRKGLQRIVTAEQATGLRGKSEAAALFCSPGVLRELREWSESEEAQELSGIDLQEQAEWNVETTAALERLSG